MSRDFTDEWHLFDDEGRGDSTSKMKVPGGWLVRYESESRGEFAGHVAICFVPDPKHTRGDDEGRIK